MSSISLTPKDHQSSGGDENIIINEPLNLDIIKDSSVKVEEPMINKSQQSLGFDFNEEEEVNNRAAMSKNDNSNIVDSISSEGLTNQGGLLQVQPRKKKVSTASAHTPETETRQNKRSKKNSVMSTGKKNTMDRFLRDQIQYTQTNNGHRGGADKSPGRSPALGVQTSPTEFSYQIPSWQQQQQTSQEYNNSESEMDELANTSGSAGQHHVKMKMSKMDSILVKNQKSVAKRRKRYLRRVVEKSGEPNIQYKNISKRRRKYFSDLYTTLVDSSWIETLLLFATSFYFTWLFFAVIYYIICYSHGDLELKSDNNVTQTPCVLELTDFASSFLFSLETQHTIGYGSRQTTNECPSAMIAMSIQSILGCLIQAFMVGLVFAKMSRPQQRARTVVFSQHAVVCQRNGKLCMVFRIGDMRHDSFIVSPALSVKVIRRISTKEGEMYHEVIPIKISPDSSEEPCIFLIWPMSVVHVIDKDSPFYKMSAHDMSKDNFELHVVLEGTMESSSMTFQARTSYLADEILWGHRFETMMLYRKDHNKYQVNFSAFHSTYEVNTPICSAFELDQHFKKYRNHTQVNSPTSNQKFQTISSAENSSTSSESEEDPDTLPV